MSNNYENEGSGAATKLTFLLAGAGIGAIVALLFAPKAGVELREDIADATRKGIDKTKETAAQLQERAGEYYEVTRDKATDLYASAKESAGDIGEKAKAVAAGTANPFTAAIEAGKQAYTAEKRKNESKSIASGRPDWGPGDKPATSGDDILDTGDGENKG
jgi:gas vesicle protein